jgi:hypothetical protein
VIGRASVMRIEEGSCYRRVFKMSGGHLSRDHVMAIGCVIMWAHLIRSDHVMGKDSLLGDHVMRLVFVIGKGHVLVRRQVLYWG